MRTNRIQSQARLRRRGSTRISAIRISNGLDPSGSATGTDQQSANRAPRDDARPAGSVVARQERRLMRALGQGRPLHMIRRAVLAAFVAALPASAQTKTLDSVSHWVDSIFAPYASARTPGCAVGVIQKGSLVLNRGYGMADLEHDTPIGSDTRFYLASISKQFT